MCNEPMFQEKEKDGEHFCDCPVNYKFVEEAKKCQPIIISTKCTDANTYEDNGECFDCDETC